MQRAQSLPALTLQAFVYFDPETKEYLAHCLQLDLVASGSDANTAGRNLMDVVREQIRFALAHDNVEYLLHPAPEEAWKRFAEILKDKFRTTNYHIDLEDQDRNFEPQLELAFAS